MATTASAKQKAKRRIKSGRKNAAARAKNLKKAAPSRKKTKLKRDVVQREQMAAPAKNAIKMAIAELVAKVATSVKIAASAPVRRLTDKH